MAPPGGEIIYYKTTKRVLISKESESQKKDFSLIPRKVPSRCLLWCFLVLIHMFPCESGAGRFSHRLSPKGRFLHQRLFMSCWGLFGKRTGIQEEAFQDVQPPMLPKCLSDISHHESLMCCTCSRRLCLSFHRSPHHVRRPPTMSR